MVITEDRNLFSKFNARILEWLKFSIALGVDDCIDLGRNLCLKACSVVSILAELFKRRYRVNRRNDRSKDV